MRDLEVLNRAFAADPNAMQALLCNRVPCNQALADDPHVVVETPPVLPSGCWQVGALGLLNGVLAGYGLPQVAARFSAACGEEGRRRLLGFTRYDVTTVADEEARRAKQLSVLAELMDVVYAPGADDSNTLEQAAKVLAIIKRAGDLRS